MLWKPVSNLKTTDSDMTYGKFKKQIKPGIHVKDDERTGIVIRISQDNEKALVRFSDGMTEWIEYWKIEIV